MRNYTIASSGWIVLCLNPSKMDTKMIVSSFQVLLVRFTSKVNQKSFQASFVYGFNTISARRVLWNDLTRWFPIIPWIIFGAFNSILS